MASEHTGPPRVVDVTTGAGPGAPSGVGVHPPVHAVSEAVARALAEDLTPLGDVTSSLVDPSVTATARFVARQGGVVAGTACARATFAAVDASVTVDFPMGDGTTVGPGDIVGVVTGPLASILTAERTALNFLSHLSGVATLTRRFVDAAAVGGAARIWDTRKTTPGLRALEKAAVRAGGGANHRGNLSEWVLIKDNHLAPGGPGFSVGSLVARARQAWPGRTVHVECDTPAQVVEAVAAGADALLLDNMSADELARCVSEVHSRCAGGARPLVEASGGVTLDTVAAISASGVDCISVGALTNAAGVLDIGLDLVVGVGAGDEHREPGGNDAAGR